MSTKRELLRDKVEARYRYWIHALEMDCWRVRFDWEDTIRLGDGQEEFRAVGGAATGKNYAVLARCDADWSYRDVMFTLSYSAQEGLTDERIDETACHEVLHAALHEMRQWKRGDKIGMPHEERVVVQLAHALVRLRDNPDLHHLVATG